MKIPDEVRAWLIRTHDVAPAEDASSRASDPVAERLLGLTRALRPACATIAGAVVVHHPSGRPFAAAVDDHLVVRVARATGALTAEAVDGLDGWVAVDPFPPDVAFARGEDALRRVLAEACAKAARSGPDQETSCAVTPHSGQSSWPPR
jgi:hypothetical protein